MNIQRINFLPKNGATLARRIVLPAMIALLPLFAGSPAFAAVTATWLATPTTSDWNTNANWTPATAPNGAADTAIFDFSNMTLVSISANTQVDGIVFNLGAATSPFTITASPTFTFTFQGVGITNNSGVTQTFVAAVNAGGGFSRIVFNNSATAGSMTVFNINGATLGGAGGSGLLFNNSSNAGTATINNNAATAAGAGSGFTAFNDGSNGGNATINNFGSAFINGGGLTTFSSSATGSSNAGSATINNNAGAVAGGEGLTQFVSGVAGGPNAGSATITNNGATIGGASGGQTDFFNTSDAGTAKIFNTGATVIGAFGGVTTFNQTSTADGATLVANGGTGGGGGGSIQFFDDSTGGTARVEVFGNGNLDISPHNAPGVTIGSIEGTGKVFLGARNLTVGSNNMSTTFSGLIQDLGGLTIGTGGSLTKIGTGTLELDSNNLYTGGTTINAGTLTVNSLNALSTGNVTLNDGTLQTLDNTPRTFNVGGNYSQFNGTLRIQIGGTKSGVNSDLMAVTGTATLSNGFPFSSTLFLHLVNKFLPAPHDMVTIITAGGGVINEFDNENESEFKGLIQPEVIYNANSVVVDFELSNTFLSQAICPNQRAVAAEMDDLAAVSPDPRTNALLGFLGSLPVGELPHAFDLIAPDELAVIYEMGFSHAITQGTNLIQRMDDIRAGSTGFCAAGYAPQVTGQGFSKGSDGKAAIEKNPAPAFVPAPENHWGIFVTGAGEFVDVENEDECVQGYQVGTGGFTVGVDYRLLHNFAVGIYGGYDAGRALMFEDGHVTMEGGNVGAFATFFWDGFYADVAGGGGWNNYKTQRTALGLNPRLEELTRGETDGSEVNVLGSIGYDWRFGCLNVGPTASFQYTNVNINQYSERGSLAPLEIQDQDEDSLRSSLGARATYDIHAGSKGVILRPEVRAAWLHEYNDQAYPIDARLASGAGGIFRVFGPTVGRDAVQIRAGGSAQLSPAFAIYVYYDGVLGRNNYSSNGGSGGFSVSF